MIHDQYKHWWGIGIDIPAVGQADVHLPLTAAPKFVISSPSATYALHVRISEHICPISSSSDIFNTGN